MNKLVKFIVRVYRRIFVMPNRKILWQIVEKLNSLQKTEAESARRQAEAERVVKATAAKQRRQIEESLAAAASQTRALSDGVAELTARVAHGSEEERASSAALTKRLEEQKGTAQKQFEELRQLLQQQLQAAHIVSRQLDGLSLQNEPSSPQGVKVSVIVPVYNTEKYLVECLESVVHQDLDSYEVLCVDDGSTDDSGAIIDAYAAKYPFIRAFHTVNRGLGAARNYGLRRAKGEYVCFVDSDDFLHENVLAKLYEEAHSCDLDILCYDGVTVFEEPELERQFSFYKTAYSLSRKKEYSAICDGQELYCQLKANGDYREVAWLHMLRRSFLLRENMWFPEGMYYEDNVFTIVCMMKAQRVSHRKINAYTYRIRRNSIMTGPSTEKNVYDRFRSYLTLAALLLGLSLRDETNNWVQRELNGLRNNALSRYKTMGVGINQCSEYFTPVSRALFGTMILDKK